MMAIVTRWRSQTKRQIFVLRRNKDGSLYAYQSESDSELVVMNSADQFFPELREAEAYLIDVSGFRNPEPELFSQVITLRGQGFTRKVKILYCSSALKSSGKAIAIPIKEDGTDNDILHLDWDLFKRAEQIVYTGTYWQGTPYTSCIAKEVRTLYVEPGAVFAGRVIDDGNLLMRGSMYDEMIKDHKGNKIVYRRGRSSWQTALMLSDDNEPLWEEMKPLLVKQIERANRPAAMRTDLLGNHQAREELAEWQPLLCPDNGRSAPYYTYFLVREAAEDLRRQIMSCHYDNVVTRVMLPPLEGQEDRVVVPNGTDKLDKSVVIGFPVQGTECMMAVQNVLTPPGDGTECAQIRMMRRDQEDKGMCDRVDDALMGDYDIVSCYENIKMAKCEVENARVPHQQLVDEVFILVTQIFDKDQICRIPHDLATLLKRDYDGDILMFVSGVDNPQLWLEVHSWPRYAAGKVEKHKSWIGRKKSGEVVDLRHTAMSIFRTNFVGWATTLAAIIWSMPEKHHTQIAASLGLKEPELINVYYQQYMSANPVKKVLALRAYVDWLVQVGTDVFKAWTEAEGLRKQLSTLGHILRDEDSGYGWDATFMNARRHGWLSRGGDGFGPDFKDENGVQLWADPRFEGMVYKIMRFTLGMVEFKDSDPAESLSYFANWVRQPEKDVLDAVEAYYTGWYNRVTRVNVVQARRRRRKLGQKVRSDEGNSALKQFKVSEQAEFERGFVRFALRKTWRHLPKGKAKRLIDEVLFLERPFAGLPVARNRVEAILATSDIPEGQQKALMSRLSDELFLEWADALWYHTHQAERSDVKHHGTAPFWCLRMEVLKAMLAPERVNIAIKANEAAAAMTDMKLVGLNFTMEGRDLPNPFEARTAQVIVRDRQRMSLDAVGFETGADVGKGFNKNQLGLFPLGERRAWLMKPGEVHLYYWRPIQGTASGILITPVGD
jgi:hypothetical protein